MVSIYALCDDYVVGREHVDGSGDVFLLRMGDDHNQRIKKRRRVCVCVATIIVENFGANRENRR